MRWSKLRKLVTERFAPSLRDRLDIHSAAYGACTCGHAWLTYDGEVIANFCTRAYWVAQGRETGAPAPNPMYRRQLTAFGELSRQDAYQSCWSFVHELAIEDALAHDDVLVRALAVADERVGQRRLARIDTQDEAPLVAAVLALRREPGVATLDALLAGNPLILTRHGEVATAG